MEPMKGECNTGSVLDIDYTLSTYTLVHLLSTDCYASYVTIIIITISAFNGTAYRPELKAV